MPEFMTGRQVERKGADFRGTSGIVVDVLPVAAQSPNDVIPRGEIEDYVAEQISLGGFGVDEEFTTAGTFVFQPIVGSTKLIFCGYAAGASGGTGYRGAPNSARPGGSGGGAGSHALVEIDLESVAINRGGTIAELYFELSHGAGGASRLGPTTNNANGSVGNSGGSIILRAKKGPLGPSIIILRISGGASGNGATTAGNATDGAAVSTFAQFIGGSGGAGSNATTGTPNPGNNSPIGPGGGAGAPGITAANVNGTPANGGAGATCTYGDIAVGANSGLGLIDAPTHSVKGCPGGGGAAPAIASGVTVSGKGFRGGGGAGGLPSNNGSATRYDSGPGGDSYSWLRWR